MYVSDLGRLPSLDSGENRLGGVAYDGLRREVKLLNLAPRRPKKEARASLCCLTTVAMEGMQATMRPTFISTMLYAVREIKG